MESRSETTAEFMHSPLDEHTADCHPIRLLHLQPSEEYYSPITCTIEHVDLRSIPRPRFKALSYAWGDANIKLAIQIEGRPYYVAANCHAALLRLREVGETAIWIDAICINQLDDDEKSVQISMMVDVYSSAAEVIVWLGRSEAERRPDDEEKEQLALGLVNQLHDLEDPSLADYQEAAKNDLDSGESRMRLTEEYFSMFKSLSLPESKKGAGSNCKPTVDETTYYQATIHRTISSRDFFISTSGYMGVGPKALEEGDMICVIPGCNVPLLIRKEGDHHLLVGECFVWGLMDGEAMEGKNVDSWRDKKFEEIPEEDGTRKDPKDDDGDDDDNNKPKREEKKQKRNARASVVMKLDKKKQGKGKQTKKQKAASEKKKPVGKTAAL
ncbi:Heterokaryon incompatibility protein 6,OR allele, partial [Lachnellula willkommii]